MEQKYPHLFSPIRIRGTLFRNRILMPPIGNWEIVPDNHMGNYCIDFWSERSQGGSASVTIGDQQVHICSPDSPADQSQRSFPLRDPLNKGRGMLVEIANGIKDYGAVPSCELAHVGGAPPAMWAMYAPSTLVMPDGTVREITKDEIKKTIREYAECAVSLKEAGFGMLLLHGGHNRLLPQFMNRNVNHRMDEYGGNLENRMRFGIELCQAVRAAVGEDFVIEYRISGYNPELDPLMFHDTIEYLKRIEEYVDIINVSAPDHWSDHPVEEGIITSTYLEKDGNNIHLAALVKPHLKKAKVAAVGTITSPEMAEEILASGQADFVLVGRSCVAEAYRGGTVIALLWAGIAELRRRLKFRYMMGCMSLDDRDPGMAWSLYEAACRRNELSPLVFGRARPANFLPYPQPFLPTAAEPEEPLFKGYLRLGAKIAGEPAWDRKFHSIDFLILLDFARITEKYARHFAVERPAD